MLGKYEREQGDLTMRMDELRPLIAEVEEQVLSTERFLRIVKAYTEIEALTAEVVNGFINGLRSVRL